MAGAVGRFPPMEVKLKGDGADKAIQGAVILAVPDPVHAEGWSLKISWADQTPKRRRSASSAMSISAWNTVLDCPSMVEALSTWR